MPFFFFFFFPVRFAQATQAQRPPGRFLCWRGGQCCSADVNDTSNLFTSDLWNFRGFMNRRSPKSLDEVRKRSRAPYCPGPQYIPPRDLFAASSSLAFFVSFYVEPPWATLACFLGLVCVVGKFIESVRVLLGARCWCKNVFGCVVNVWTWLLVQTGLFSLAKDHRGATTFIFEHTWSLIV